MNLAMWSGPRNLSTALMYSFAARDDFCAIDEPFYACYLAQTGLQHPMRDAVLNAQPHDADTVIQDLTAQRGPHYYQKHMTQHMLPDIRRDWILDVTNVFLIRHPYRVIASFDAKYENPTADDLGFRQQAELFDFVMASGKRPIVVDSADIRRAPRETLNRLCAAIDLPFDEKMLAWTAGPKPYDGVWAPHWYNAVHKSTCFAAAEGEIPELSKDLTVIADQSMQHYSKLRHFVL